MIQLPRVIDASGNEIKRLHPVRASVSLSITPLSTASIELLPGEFVKTRSLIEMYTSAGSAGIFRARAPQEGYGDITTTVELEHAVSEIGDYLITEKIEQEMSAADAMQKLFSFYRGTLWQLGTVAAADKVTVQADYDNVLESMLAIMDQIPSYMMEFDQTSFPWKVNIVSRQTAVSAEGRLSRNVESVRVIRDDTELCTRVYMKGLGGVGVYGHMDADTIAEGIVEREIEGDDEVSVEKAQRIAKLYLERHKRPKLSIRISGRDLHGVTGEPLDALAIGKKYRLAIPEAQTAIEETITALEWDDIYGDEDGVTVSLAEEEDTVVTFLRKQSTTGGRNGRSSRKAISSTVYKVETLNNDIITEFERTDTEIRANAKQIDENKEVLRQAGMYIDINGVLQYANDFEKNIGSMFKAQSDAISAEVTRATKNEEAMSALIAMNAEEITSKVSKGAIASTINQTAQSVLIQASKINLSGYVTASQLSATQADIDNLKTGASTASTLRVTNLVVKGNGCDWFTVNATNGTFKLLGTYD